jgi:hypothetical protein
MDQHRVAWLTTGDGRGYATLRRVRFAADGRNRYVVAEGFGGVAEIFG